MRRVAVVMVLIIAAMTAATLVVRGSNERIAAMEQARAENEALVRHLSKIEEMLSASLNRPVTTDANDPPGATSARPVSPKSATSPAPEASLTPEQRATREEGLRAGNAIVDRAIATGLWNPADMGILAVVTKDLSADDRAQIMVRLTAAINADQVKFDRSRRP